MGAALAVHGFCMAHWVLHGCSINAAWVLLEPTSGTLGTTTASAGRLSWTAVACTSRGGGTAAGSPAAGKGSARNWAVARMRASSASIFSFDRELRGAQHSAQSILA